MLSLLKISQYNGCRIRKLDFDLSANDMFYFVNLMFRNMGFNPYKLQESSLDDVKNKFKELKQKRDELKEVQYGFQDRL